jgi:hypothetical protein
MFCKTIRHILDPRWAFLIFGRTAIFNPRAQLLIPSFHGGPFIKNSFAFPQYVARPPEISNTAPVENEQSSDASHAIIAASSSTVTKRFIGIFDSM